MIPLRALHPYRIALALLLGCALLAGGHLRADDDDHDRARQALEQGEVLPLRTVLDIVERDFQGHVLEIEFERKDDRFIYEIRLLQDDGHIVKFEVDATDGSVIEIKRRKH